MAVPEVVEYKRKYRETYPIPFEFAEDAAGEVPIDVSGYSSIRAQLREGPRKPLIFEFTIDDTEATDGRITLGATDEQWLLLTKRRYEGDIRSVDGDGVEYIGAFVLLMEGSITA